MPSEYVTVHLNIEGPEEVVVGVLLFNGKKWKLHTVAAPEPEMMRDIKNALLLLHAEFERNGF